MDDKLVEEVNYNLDIYTQEFMLHQKINYTYDANDNQILSIDSIWMTDTQMWNAAGKSESTYNNNDNLTQTIYHIWDNITNAWRYSSKRDYDYDINGNAILELGSIWQIATNQWEQNFKAERTFDEANNEIGNAFYLWDNDQWIGSSNNVSAYNAAGNRTLNETYQGWDIYTEQWIGSTKREYAYDTNENYVLFNTYSWNSSTFEWENDYQLHFNYDNTYHYSELIIPYSEVSFRHKRTDYTRDEWDATTGQWTPDTARGTYYYSQQLVGIENIAETNINLFPNPAQDEVIFDLGYTPTPPMIELYNTQGQLTDIQPLNNNKISVKHLNSGIYFYQLFNGTQQYGGKLIVR